MMTTDEALKWLAESGGGTLLIQPISNSNNIEIAVHPHALLTRENPSDRLHVTLCRLDEVPHAVATVCERARRAF